MEENKNTEMDKVMEENKNIEKTGKEIADKKEIDTDEIVRTLFNTPFKEEEEKKKKKPVKKPVNIFSRPINVMQDEEGRRWRIKNAVIEGLLFGAFITAITVIYSLSGLDFSLDPDAPTSEVPSLFFYFCEFIFFSALIGAGDYFMTEKRVNEYNQSVAGISVDLFGEIETALKEQEKDGITAEDAAAQNKSSGEEAPLIVVEPVGDATITDKAFVAKIKDVECGKIETCKGIILDSNGFEHIVLAVKTFVAEHETYASGVASGLVDAVKEAATVDGIPAVVIPKSIFGEKDFVISDGEKYGIKYMEELKVSESYPGALLEISGEFKW
ncbi:MAG: hypothetical protein GX241_03695 [Ruminococcaceae bacterium]|nr:hypothetical protein [Oscillospiraceae bacterium]